MTHIHDVMALLRDVPSFSAEQLIAQMQQQFGEQARFRTCKLKDLTAPQVIEVLLAKEKIAQQADGNFQWVTQACCSHH